MIFGTYLHCFFMFVHDLFGIDFCINLFTVSFLSKKYHEIAVEEANYAKGLEKLGNTQILFAMLDENYHTDSAPFRVSGWLGNMVTGTTWYPCWTQFQAESVGIEIISNINRTVDQRIVKKLKKPKELQNKPLA